MTAANARLLRLSPALEQAIADDPDYQEAMSKEDWTQLANAVVRVVGGSLSDVGSQPPELHWGGYLAVDENTQEVVGSCGFKGPPTADATVEIAYFTYPGFEGRGYATAMARQLVELASRAPEVRRVVAHTLPETNASTRILERLGMAFAGEVVDPDDGLVWRWELLTRDAE